MNHHRVLAVFIIIVTLICLEESKPSRKQYLIPDNAVRYLMEGCSTYKININFKINIIIIKSHKLPCHRVSSTLACTKPGYTRAIPMYQSQTNTLLRSCRCLVNSMQAENTFARHSVQEPCITIVLFPPCL